MCSTKEVPAGVPTLRLELKYQNGTVTECSTVEELLSLENAGPKQIVRLYVTVDDGAESEHFESKVSVVVRFTNVREEDDTRSIVNRLLREGRC
jgi:hypothetical protein